MRKLYTEKSCSGRSIRFVVLSVASGTTDRAMRVISAASELLLIIMARWPTKRCKQSGKFLQASHHARGVNDPTKPMTTGS
jgi:hypothetical protein